MKITPQCVPCLLKRVVFEAEASRPDRAQAALKAACKVFAEHYTGKEVSAELATLVHKAAYEAIGDKDPYKAMKERANMAAVEVLPEAEGLVEASDDRLGAAIKVSIIGNILDFGIEGVGGPERLAKDFGRMFKEGLAVDDTHRFRSLISKGKEVLLFTDNCGEVVFDGLLSKVMREEGAKVFLVVKGEPVLTDATRADVEKLGIGAMADGVLDTGGFAVGVDLKAMGPELRTKLEGGGKADLIISKGMANFESFSSSKIGPIAFLMRSKCRPVSEAAGVPHNKSVVVFRTRANADK